MRHTLFKHLTLSLAPLFVVLSVSPAVADLLSNGEFETMGTSANTFHSGVGGQGLSAAADWGIFHNADGTTETNWLTYEEAGIPTIFAWQNPSTDHLLRLEVSHAGNGLVQQWAPTGTGADAATGSVWVYVTNQNQIVGTGVGNGGATSTSKMTSGVGGRWEELSFVESNSPVNEMIIYAETSGAEFYVDLANVDSVSVPEPTSAIVVSILGITGLCLRRKRV